MCKIRCNRNPGRCLPELACTDIELLRPRKRFSQRLPSVFRLSGDQEHEHPNLALQVAAGFGKSRYWVSARSVRNQGHIAAHAREPVTRSYEPAGVRLTG